jgi:cardiolipin synthase A/B
MIFKFFSIFLLIISISCSKGKLDLITLPEDGKKTILQLIDSAKESIDLSLYKFSDETIAKHLIFAKDRGVNVRILLNNSLENDVIKEFFLKNKIFVKYSSKFKKMHRKILIIDGQTRKPSLAIMTFDFDFFVSRNFSLITHDKKVVKDVLNIFQADFNDKDTKVQNELIVISPDNSKEKIINFISQAKHSLDIYIMFLYDEDIEKALFDAIVRKVNVRILFSPYHRDFSMINRLNQQGASLKVLAYPFINATVMIKDQNTAFLGSQDLSSASLNQNKELGVFIKNLKISQKLQATFENDFKKAKYYLSEVSFNFYKS